MEEKTRGYVEMVFGTILIFAILGIAIGVAMMVGATYAPELGYLYILLSGIVGILAGLVSGMLLLSGYLRISDKRK